MECNVCWKGITQGYRTLCCHLFCVEDGTKHLTASGGGGAVEGKARCPLCDTTLDPRTQIWPYKAEVDETYKTQALLGLSPQVIQEMTLHAVQFWEYQRRAQKDYQVHLRKQLLQRKAQAEMEERDKVVQLTNEKNILSNELHNMRKLVEELQREKEEITVKYQDKQREKRKLEELYDQLRSKRMHLDAVAIDVNAPILSSSSSGAGAGASATPRIHSSPAIHHQQQYHNHHQLQPAPPPPGPAPPPPPPPPLQLHLHQQQQSQQQQQQQQTIPSSRQWRVQSSPERHASGPSSAGALSMGLGLGTPTLGRFQSPFLSQHQSLQEASQHQHQQQQQQQHQNQNQNQQSSFVAPLPTQSFSSLGAPAAGPSLRLRGFSSSIQLSSSSSSSTGVKGGGIDSFQQQQQQPAPPPRQGVMSSTTALTAPLSTPTLSRPPLLQRFAFNRTPEGNSAMSSNSNNNNNNNNNNSNNNNSSSMFSSRIGSPTGSLPSFRQWGAKKT